MTAKMTLLSTRLRTARTIVAAALLTVATYAIAQEFRGDHPDTYVVKRGDTLWDIAGRFLTKPWLWPEIWQANPQVANPHLIYPGDVLSLAYLNRVTVSQPASRAADTAGTSPITAIPLSDVERFLKDLRVVDQFEDLPHVVGLEDDRLLTSQGQMAYVRGLTGASPGSRYVVLRPLQRYSRLPRGGSCCDRFHKVGLDFRGKSTLSVNEYWRDMNDWSPRRGRDFLGYELVRVNAGTLTRGEADGIEASTLLLDDSGAEVRVGDRVVPVDIQPYDLQFFPHPPRQNQDYGHARILSVTNMMRNGGPRDVVALSVGRNDGIDNGTVFSIWRVGSNTVDRVEYGMDRTAELVSAKKKVRLPDEYAAHVMVFRTFDNISYGLVMEAIKPIQMGYELKHPDAAY